MKKNSLYYDIKKSIQSQIIQIVVNLIFNDNVHSMTLESTLSSLKQQAVVNSSSNKQILTLCSCFDNHDNDFLKRIKVKKSVNYYSKSFHEHSK